MKINSIQNHSFTRALALNKLGSGNQVSQNYMSSPMQDTFVKSTNVSFKGGNDDKDWLAALGLCLMFAAPSVFAIAYTKAHSKDVIKLDKAPNGQEELVVDADVAKEAGIDLSKDRFTFADPINGVFKNPEKGIDINLSEEKYIDPENGIYLDKESEMSLIYNGDGFEYVPIPNVSFCGFNTPGVSGGFGEPIYALHSREKFIKEHDGIAPEDYYNGEKPQHPILGFTPIDRRSNLEKLKDWFTNKYPEQHEHDYWGRELVTVNDAQGVAHKIPLNEEINQIMQDKNLSYEDVQNIMTYTAKNSVVNFMGKTNPELLSKYNLDSNHVDIQDFSSGNTHSHDYIHNQHNTEVSHSGDDIPNDDGDSDLDGLDGLL